MVPATKWVSSAGSIASNSAMVDRSMTPSAVASTRSMGTSRPLMCWWCGSTTIWVTAGATGSTTTRVTLPQAPSVQLTWAPIVTGSVPSMGVLLCHGSPGGARMVPLGEDQIQAEHAHHTAAAIRPLPGAGVGVGRLQSGDVTGPLVGGLVGACRDRE